MLRSKIWIGAQVLVASALLAAPAFAGPKGWKHCLYTDEVCSGHQYLAAGSQSTEAARDPFLCRFGAVETGAPVLLAATREDCTRAGGTVMAPAAAPDAAARE